MAIGLIGRKAGMTRIFTDEGTSIPVTVIEVEPNRVSQVCKLEKDGYRAIQVAAGNRKTSQVTKPMAGHYAKNGIAAGRVLVEFRLDEGEGEGLEAGNSIDVSIFKAGQKVDVRGRTIGRGYSGGIRRHHFSSQRMTHGNSISHRAPGSIGQCQTPGRVFKGKKMAGQHGNENRTQQNLEVVRVDSERNLILVKGTVPGASGGDLILVPSVKQKSKG